MSRDDPEYGHLVPLLERYASLDPDDPVRDELREWLVRVPAGGAPRRPPVRHRGEPLDDLVQVATVGFINAINRFQPNRGNDFLSFAVPTITGEVRRHFRDHGWSMRVPRRLKDMHIAIDGDGAVLAQQHGRAPTASEIAKHLEPAGQQILEGLEAARRTAPPR